MPPAPTSVPLLQTAIISVVVFILGTEAAIQRDPTEVDRVMRGIIYLNIETEACPGGELRGQLYRSVVPESKSWQGSLIGVGVVFMAVRWRNEGYPVAAPNTLRSRQIS